MDVYSTGFHGATSLSFKGAMKAERFGLITSILTLNGLNFSASCDESKKKKKKNLESIKRKIKSQKLRMRKRRGSESGSGREEVGESLGWGDGAI